MIDIISILINPLVMFGVVAVVGGSFYMRRKFSAYDIASFATTTGIAFTFFGIVLALGKLAIVNDASDVQSKVNALLDGVFVAFIPSIFGALVSVWTHVKPNFWGKPIDEHDEKETDLDKLILQELRTLNKNLVGDAEISLTTRLEKFQLKVTENQDALQREFQKFAERVADKIIDALSESMSKLNEKLGEQFGENFAKFADVIPKLLEWQEQYREIITNTQKQLNEQSKHLEGLLNALAPIEKLLANISASSSNLEHSAESVSKSFSQSAESIAQMRLDAENLLSAAKRLTETVEKQTAQNAAHSDALKSAAASLATVSQNANILDGTARQLNEHMDGLKRTINTLTSGLGAVERLSDTMQKKGESIEKSMREITEGVVRELANNLRGISEALVRDYRSVQESMREIKRISDENRGRNA